MSRPRTDIIPFAAQAEPPAYRLNDTVLDTVLSALPPMTATAPAAWHRMRRERVRQEIMALHPTDAAQEAIAGHIVVARYHAADTMALAARPANSPAEARRLDRTARGLARAGKGLERTLRQRQKMVRSPGGGIDWGSIDWLALDAVWRRGAVQIDAVAECEAPGAGIASLGADTAAAENADAPGVTGIVV
jgi:hypothetical protein